jgi:hypothetical protein
VSVCGVARSTHRFSLMCRLALPASREQRRDDTLETRCLRTAQQAEAVAGPAASSAADPAVRVHEERLDDTYDGWRECRRRMAAAISVLELHRTLATRIAHIDPGHVGGSYLTIVAAMSIALDYRRDFGSAANLSVYSAPISSRPLYRIPSAVATSAFFAFAFAPSLSPPLPSGPRCASCCPRASW